MVSYAHEFLISSSAIDSTSSVNEKSLDLLFDNHFISLVPDKYLHLQSFYLFTGSKLRWHFPGLLVQITESRLVTMSVSLHTQTGLWCLTIQVLNIRVCFLNIWYTSLTSVHSNLAHGLAILIENFSPLKSQLHNLLCWNPN